jgi:hypothetical protein
MATTTTSGRPYGLITLDGIDYIERSQVFVTEAVINAPFDVLTNQRLTLPGVANFLLKGLTRDSTHPGDPDSEPERFRFRLINSEASTWFFTGGLGIFDDRAVDSLCFGSGQFPFPIIPPVPVHATGSLLYEVEDLGLRPNLPTLFPYIIHFGFHGAYLFPPDQISTQGPLAFRGTSGNGFVRTR